MRLKNNNEKYNLYVSLAIKRTCIVTFLLYIDYHTTV